MAQQMIRSRPASSTTSSGTYADLSGRGLGDGPRAKPSRTSRQIGRSATTRSRSSSADHQNKPDVGSTVARQWYDVRTASMLILDVPTSSVALAVSHITKDKNKVLINSGAATSDLTGKACTPNTVHWTYDTWRSGPRHRRRRRQGRWRHAGSS
jgi:branched-chain amino acid transport system substrate-binding protein